MAEVQPSFRPDHDQASPSFCLRPSNFTHQATNQYYNIDSLQQHALQFSAHNPSPAHFSGSWPQVFTGNANSPSNSSTTEGNYWNQSRAAITLAPPQQPLYFGSLEFHPTSSPRREQQRSHHLYNPETRVITESSTVKLDSNFESSPHTSQHYDLDNLEPSTDPGLQQPQDPALHSGSPNGSYQYPHDTPNYNDSQNLNVAFMDDVPQTAQPSAAPVSPQGDLHETPRDESLEPPQNGRKRSFGEMSQSNGAGIPPNPYDPQITDPQMNEPHSRRDSETSLGAFQDPQASPNGDYNISPKPAKTIKRGDPPTNADNKFICTWAEECEGQTFDRKCEWSKHMDKHDRPYRCPHLSCEKLQGFTYSGGLLRHEREVHGKHGGPKEKLMCPFSDCKRSNGKGFTRKENLHEHVRRCHTNKGTETDAASAVNPALDALPGAEQQNDTPASKISETLENALEPALSAKRQRLDGENGGSESDEDLRKENEQLRVQNGQYHARILELEAHNKEQDNRLRMLEDSLRQHTQVQPQMSDPQLFAQQMTEQLQQGMQQEAATVDEKVV